MSKITELERQERREADRKKSRAAVEALTSSEGWTAWLASRRHFHAYSLANQLLVAMQLPSATRVAGFRAWLKLGYCVRRGETAIGVKQDGEVIVNPAKSCTFVTGPEDRVVVLAES